MKIGILTYHNTNNFGASLQCFALQKTLTDLNLKSEIINYKNKLVTSSNRNKINIIKAILQKPIILLKKSKFKKFSNKYLNLSSKYNNKKTLLKKIKKYDYYLIGSDQVWNYNINGGDTTYFFDFVKEKDKIKCYACSAGVSEVPLEIEKKYSNQLTEIQDIVVREENTAELVKKLTKKDAIITPDPVFLLKRDYWDKFSEIGKSLKESYVMSYFVGQNVQATIKELCHNYFKDEKLLKVAGGLQVSEIFNKKIKIKFSISPMTFLNYLKNAKYIYTDSFHATAFCLIFNKPFNVFLSENYGKDSRILNLLQRYNMLDKIIEKDKINSNNKPNFEVSLQTITEELNNESMHNLKKYSLKGII